VPRLQFSQGNQVEAVKQLDESTPASGSEVSADDEQARERSLQLGGAGIGPGFLAKYFGFLSGVRDELSKVTWPTRKMVLIETFVVLVVVFFFTALITGLDRLFALVFNRVLFGG
jgi:preprotein translocase SecE subunit